MNEQPFRPGDLPLYLAGRADVQSDIADITRLIGQYYRPVILEGARGVGKTSLVDWANTPAAEHGLIHIQLDASTGGSLVELLSAWMLRHPDQLREFGIGVSGAGDSTTDIELAVGPVRAKRSTKRAPSSGLRSSDSTDAVGVLTPILTAAAQRGSGVLVSADEAQAGGPRLVAELSALLSAVRAESLPLNLLISGLPTLRDLVAPNRENQGSLGQLERASWHSLLPWLDDGDAAKAISEPIRSAGGSISDDAVSQIIALTSGYPYAVQLLGDTVWKHLPDQRADVQLDDVLRVDRLYQKLLEDSMLTSRWRQLPPAERDYVVAAAQVMSRSADGDSVSNSMVAGQLGKEPSATTYLRQRLLDRGILVRPPHNPRSTAFIVPSMQDFVLRQAAD